MRVDRFDVANARSGRDENTLGAVRALDATLAQPLDRPAPANLADSGQTVVRREDQIGHPFPPLT